MMRSRTILALIASAVAFVVALRAAVAGSIGPATSSFVVPLLFLGCVAAAFQARACFGGVDPSRPLLRRHGFYLVAIATTIALPTLGTTGLVDPWETHYAEVAREMIERGDFVSPWWANEGWFMSKPVLTFWLEAIAMVVLGVRTGPDQVLGGGSAHPEWAVRFPGFALALVGSYLLYTGVRRTHGRRAGFIGGVVLWTMPGFALLTHQAITDLPLLGCLAASLGLLLRALSTDDREQARRELRWSVAAIIGFVTLGQVLLLLAQHLHFDGTALHPGPDRLLSGSPHACGLPSQPACKAVAIAHARLSPLLQASLWAPLSIWLVVHAAHETRAQRLFALLAWTFAALGAMAKGPVGLVVPAAAVLVHVVASRSLRGGWRMDPAVGVVLAIVMIAPWYLAVWVRHGRVFIDELVFRHMLGRTLDHLHDTNEGEDVGIVYFVSQLAWATFPWTGLAGIAVASATSAPRTERRDRATTRAILFGAAMSSFALVSIMRTKFHHYMLIVLPGLAMLTGIWVDELLTTRGKRGRQGEPPRRTELLGAACIAGLVGRELASTTDGTRGPARFILLLTYRYARAWPSTSAFATTIVIVAVAFVALGSVAVWARARRHAVVGLGVIAGAFAALVLDAYLPRCAVDGGQREVLATYYRARPPDDRSALVAYQLNWKGENFYTGNNVAIFIASGEPLKTYLHLRRARGEHTVFFVTERGRVAALERELGAVASFEELTRTDASAEFTLVRAVL